MNLWTNTTLRRGKGDSVSFTLRRAQDVFIQDLETDEGCSGRFVKVAREAHVQWRQSRHSSNGFGRKRNQ